MSKPAPAPRAPDRRASHQARRRAREQERKSKRRRTSPDGRTPSWFGLQLSHERLECLAPNIVVDRADILETNAPALVDHIGLRRAGNAQIDRRAPLRIVGDCQIRIAQLLKPLFELFGFVLPRKSI